MIYVYFSRLERFVNMLGLLGMVFKELLLEMCHIRKIVRSIILNWFTLRLVHPKAGLFRPVYTPIHCCLHSLGLYHQVKIPIRQRSLLAV